MSFPKAQPYHQKYLGSHSLCIKTCFYGFVAVRYAKVTGMEATNKLLDDWQLKGKEIQNKAKFCNVVWSGLEELPWKVKPEGKKKQPLDLVCSGSKKNGKPGVSLTQGNYQNDTLI